jgi:hypothetical protein
MVVPTWRAIFHFGLPAPSENGSMHGNVSPFRKPQPRKQFGYPEWFRKKAK